VISSNAVVRVRGTIVVLAQARWLRVRSFCGMAARAGLFVAASVHASCGSGIRDGAQDLGGNGASPASAGGGGRVPSGGASSGGSAGDLTGGNHAEPKGGTPGGVGGSGGGGESGRSGAAGGSGGAAGGGGGESGQPGAAGADGGSGGLDFDCSCTTCTAPSQYCHIEFIDEDSSAVPADASCRPVPRQCENDYSCECIGAIARFDGQAYACTSRLGQLPPRSCIGDAQSGVSVWVPGP